MRPGTPSPPAGPSAMRSGRSATRAAAPTGGGAGEAISIGWPERSQAAPPGTWPATVTSRKLDLPRKFATKSVRGAS